MLWGGNWKQTLVVVAVMLQPSDEDEFTRRNELPFPPLGLIEANVRETDVTAVVVIQSVRQVSDDGIYASFEYDAQIEELIQGQTDLRSKLKFRENAELTLLEDGKPPHLRGDRLLVSLVGETSPFVVADNGYVFSCETRLLAAARKAATR